MTIIKSTIVRDKVAIELYPTGCAFLRIEPMDDNEIQGFTDPITLYYSPSVVCGCSTCKGWKKYRRGDVEVHYYDMD